MEPKKKGFSRFSASSDSSSGTDLIQRRGSRRFARMSEEAENYLKNLTPKQLRKRLIAATYSLLGVVKRHKKLRKSISKRTSIHVATLRSGINLAFSWLKSAVENVPVMPKELSPEPGISGLSVIKSKEAEPKEASSESDSDAPACAIPEQKLTSSCSDLRTPPKGSFGNSGTRVEPGYAPTYSAITLHGFATPEITVETMQLIRTSIDFKEMGINRSRLIMGQMNSLIIEVEGPPDCTTMLRNRIHDLPIDRSIRIQVPEKFKELCLQDIDESLGTNAIVSELARVANCLPQDFIIASPRKCHPRSQKLHVKCPVSIADILIASSPMPIGLSLVSIIPLPANFPRCFKCLPLGYNKLTRSSKFDSSVWCANCGLADHTAPTCSHVSSDSDVYEL